MAHRCNHCPNAGCYQLLKGGSICDGCYRRRQSYVCTDAPKSEGEYRDSLLFGPSWAMISDGLQLGTWTFCGCEKPEDRDG